MNQVKNRILKTELIDIGELTPFQGTLKTLDDKNFNKLRKSIVDEGFSFTVHVWQNADVIYIIDGHQRVSVLTQMRKQGIDIPPISCSFITAKTYRDAKKLVLLAVSQYGKIQKDGFLEFVDGEDFDFGDYDFPDIGINLDELFSPEKSMTEKVSGEDANAENEEFKPSLSDDSAKELPEAKLTLTVQCRDVFELEDLFQELNSRDFKVKI